MTLLPFSHQRRGAAGAAAVTITVLVALLVCLIPTTIGGLLSAIGIAGMDRMIQHERASPCRGRAVEAAGDVDVLLLDKTGTITLGNRQATRVHPGRRASTERELADAAQLASLADETPEGRSIVVLAKEQFGIRERDVREHARATFIPFTAQTRMSGVDLDGRADPQGRGGRRRGVRASRHGGDAARRRRRDRRATSPEAGGTPLVVADGRRARSA